jgi:hypothetical protein
MILKRFITVFITAHQWSLTCTTMNPLLIFVSYFLNLHFNIILLSTISYQDYVLLFLPCVLHDQANAK